MQFLVSDLDSRSNRWWDRLDLSGSFTFGLGANVAGAGTAGDPFRNRSSGNNLATTSPAGNVTVSYPGPITSITLAHWSAAGSDATDLFLGNLFFEAPGCA